MKTVATLLAAGVGVLVVLTVPLLQAASNWSQFRGPSGDGLAEGAKPPIRFGPNTNLLWKVDISRGHSSPVLGGGLIFLTGFDGTHLETVCLDARSGNTRWRQPLEGTASEKVHAANSLATPTPVCDQARVYAYFGSFGLVAYDFEGHEVWRHPLPIPKTFMNQGTGTSPVQIGDAVIVFEQNGNDSMLLAFRATDGHELWEAKCPVYNNTYSTPISWTEANGKRVGLACAGRFSAFDTQTGDLVWWTDGLSKQVCGTPVTKGGVLYLSSASVQGERSNMKLPPSFEEFSKKYDLNKDGFISFNEVPADYLFTDRQTSAGAGNMTLRQAMQFFGGIDKSKPLTNDTWKQMLDGLKGFIESEWNNSNLMAVRAGGTGDVTKSNRLWQETRGIPEIASALIYGQRLYQVRSGGLLVCRDVDTGKLIYEERLAAAGGYFASPVAADGRIYTASDQGIITVIQAGDQFRELAHNELGENIKATPALLDDRILVRTAEHFWAFGGNAPK